ncbi:hypothetical protein [Ktedonobacter robiniae]|uniref:Uncharacterized protein n=1 Tax=Ktedonobacter robiniae TaxID=2778365 RepID=A0ABQ3UHC8_9CHLR|nr:hypothetical protein [Ktedonobacter robiniae]GHO52121.1 hypothetical protein KSB_05960 [Ktedonobacter robiniae]
MLVSATPALMATSNTGGERAWLMVMLIVGVLFIVVGCAIALFTLYTYRKAR